MDRIINSNVVSSIGRGWGAGKNFLRCNSSSIFSPIFNILARYFAWGGVLCLFYPQWLRRWIRNNQTCFRVTMLFLYASLITLTFYETFMIQKFLIQNN